MKKLWALATIVMLLMTFYQINITYAKYIAEVNTQTQKNIGAWKVKVNDTDIANGVANQEFNINTIAYDSNGYVASGKIAPGLEGYFDIAIDTTGTSVAVVCDISIDFSLLNIGDAIKFTDVERIVDGVATTDGIIRTDENKYSTIINLDEIENEKIVTIRFSVKWEDEDTEQGDESDSSIGGSSITAIDMPVEVVISQYLGEELIPYTSSN